MSSTARIRSFSIIFTFDELNLTPKNFLKLFRNSFFSDISSVFNLEKNKYTVFLFHKISRQKHRRWLYLQNKNAVLIEYVFWVLIESLLNFSMSWMNCYVHIIFVGAVPSRALKHSYKEKGKSYCLA